MRTNPSKNVRVTDRISLVIITVLGMFITFGSIGNTAFGQESERRHHGPPPEAYTACEGKSVGDTAEFVDPRGETVTGTCEQEGDRLVLRPDRPPRGKNAPGERKNAENGFE